MQVRSKLGRLPPFHQHLLAPPRLSIRKVSNGTFVDVGILHSILGMAFQDLSTTNITILGATLEQFPEVMGTHMEDFTCPCILRALFKS